MVPKHIVGMSLSSPHHEDSNINHTDDNNERVGSDPPLAPPSSAASGDLKLDSHVHVGTSSASEASSNSHSPVLHPRRKNRSGSTVAQVGTESPESSTNTATTHSMTDVSSPKSLVGLASSHVQLPAPLDITAPLVDSDILYPHDGSTKLDCFANEELPSLIIPTLQRRTAEPEYVVPYAAQALKRHSPGVTSPKECKTALLLSYIKFKKDMGEAADSVNDDDFLKNIDVLAEMMGAEEDESGEENDEGGNREAEEDENEDAVSEPEYSSSSRKLVSSTYSVSSSSSSSLNIKDKKKGKAERKRLPTLPSPIRISTNVSIPSPGTNPASPFQKVTKRKAFTFGMEPSPLGGMSGDEGVGSNNQHKRTKSSSTTFSVRGLVTTTAPLYPSAVTKSLSSSTTTTTTTTTSVGASAASTATTTTILGTARSIKSSSLLSSSSPLASKRRKGSRLSDIPEKRKPSSSSTGSSEADSEDAEGDDDDEDEDDDEDDEDEGVDGGEEGEEEEDGEEAEGDGDGEEAENDKEEKGSRRARSRSRRMMKVESPRSLRRSSSGRGQLQSSKRGGSKAEKGLKRRGSSHSTSSPLTFSWEIPEVSSFRRRDFQLHPSVFMGFHRTKDGWNDSSQFEVELERSSSNDAQAPVSRCGSLSSVLEVDTEAPAEALVSSSDLEELEPSPTSGRLRPIRRRKRPTHLQEFDMVETRPSPRASHISPTARVSTPKGPLTPRRSSTRTATQC